MQAKSVNRVDLVWIVFLMTVQKSQEEATVE